MCSPTSSDQIHNLKKEIEARGITTSLNNSGPILSPDEIAQLFSMMQGLNDIDAIKFAGGEPLLMPEVEEFVDTLIAHGQTNIRLRFITNATVFKEKWLERFNHFRAVDLLCSIDGVEDTVEYQRYPVKWETLDKNFRRYYNARLDCRLQVDLTPTISLLNFNGLPKFFDWASEFPENELSFGMVHHPSYLDYRLIPLKNREQTVDYLQTLDLDKLFNHYDPVWQTFLQDNLLDYRQITTSESQQLRDISSKVWDFRCKEKFLNRYPWAQELINAG
jgi:MoaA/NifB/PqqE/SkfB family radical SAM enzyme